MSGSLLQVLGDELRELLQPIQLAVEDPWWLDRLLAELGVSSAAAGGAALVAALRAVADLRTQLAALADASSPSLPAIGALLDASDRAFAAIRALSDGGGPAAAIGDLGEALVTQLVATHLGQRHPFAYRLGALLGLIVPFDESERHLARGPFGRARFRLDRLPDLCRDPLAVLRAEYGNPLATVADANAMADKLFRRIARLIAVLGVPCRYGLHAADVQPLGAAAPLVDHALVVYASERLTGATADAGFVLTLSSADRGDLGLVVSPFGGLTLTGQVRDWVLELEFSADIQAFAVGRHGLTLLAADGTTSVSGKFGATLPAPSDGPAFVLGARDGTRLEVGGAAIAAELALDDGQRALALSAALSAAALVIAPGDGDGLLQRILPRDGLRAEFDLGLAWSNARGLTVRGSAGLDAALPLDVTIGPVQVPTAYVALRAGDDGVVAEASLAVGLSLGPVRAVVDRVGMTATATFPSDGGNLGVADVALAFKLPSGVGLSIDAGVVEGGGYLGHSGHRYEGAFDLTVCGVAVKAYGLIETELPGGAAGYSALVILSAEFSPGLQIGFGFTLDGVGGLLGLHRTLSIESVQTAVWGHHFDGLLFPKDPIAAAPSLMTAIDSYFPAAQGRYLFGPLAKIGWGDGMAEALVGLVLEVPSPVRLLLMGEIDVHVPVVAPQLELHIDFDGGVDFGKKLAFFDATLHDSRIERYPIVGGLAFRYAWGDEPELVLSLGGFNPHYQPPANFPALQRLGITIGDSGAQLVAQAYVAVTSNTLQFGAKAELTAGTGSFNVHGWLGFDALVERNPFAFTFDISAGVELRHHTSVLASVHLEGHVSGTAPWHVSGEASISCWFFDISVHFDKSWGGTATALPATDPMPAVRAALAQPSAWTSVLAPAVKAAVTVQSAPTDAGGAVLLEPAGALRVAQRVVPLGEPITRFGGTPLGRTLTLGIDALNVQGKTSWTATTEEFAPAQYEEMSDAEKLSLPSFTRMTAGAQIGGEDVDVGQSGRTRAVETQLEYDTEVIDTWTAPRRPVGTYAPTLGAQLAMNGRSGGARPATPPPRVRLAPEQYVIAGASDLTARGDLGGDGSKRGALRALAQYLDSNPAARDQLQVVLAHEAA